MRHLMILVCYIYRCYSDTATCYRNLTLSGICIIVNPDVSDFIYIKKMFGAMHFNYYINRSIATKVDSIYLGYWPTAHSAA